MNQTLAQLMVMSQQLGCQAKSRWLCCTPLRKLQIVWQLISRSTVAQAHNPALLHASFAVWLVSLLSCAERMLQSGPYLALLARGTTLFVACPSPWAPDLRLLAWSETLGSYCAGEMEHQPTASSNINVIVASDALHSVLMRVV